MQWFMHSLRRCIDFSGRSRRTEYWWFVLFRLFLGFVPLFVGLILLIAGDDGSADATSGGGNPSLTLAGTIVFVISLIALLALFVPGLAVSVRRLHDVGYSGAWLLISLVPLGYLVLVAFSLMDSTPGPNQWGPNPKGIDHPPWLYGQISGYGQPGGYGYPVGLEQNGGHGHPGAYRPNPYGSPGQGGDIYAQGPHGHQTGPSSYPYGNHPYGPQ